VAAAEAGNACHLLIFLDQEVGLPVDVLEWNLDLNFALGGAAFFDGTVVRRTVFDRRIFDLSRAHSNLSNAARRQSRKEIAPLRRNVPQT